LKKEKSLSKQKFDKPLEEWIDETVEIPVIEPVLNKNNQIEYKETTKKFKQKTFYSNKTPTRMVCGDHHFICVDKANYIFKCTKCDWHYKSHPITHRFDEKRGKLVHRKTNQDL
jgi:hypothetical protein